MVGPLGILQGRLEDHLAGSRFGHAEMERGEPPGRRGLGGRLFSDVAGQQANASEDRPTAAPRCPRVLGNSIGNRLAPWAFPERRRY